MNRNEPRIASNMHFTPRPYSHRCFTDKIPCLFAVSLCSACLYAQSVFVTRHFEHVGDPNRNITVEILAGFTAHCGRGVPETAAR